MADIIRGVSFRDQDVKDVSKYMYGVRPALKELLPAASTGTRTVVENVKIKVFQKG